MPYGNKISQFSYWVFPFSLYIKVIEGTNTARLQNIAMRYKIIIVFSELHKGIMIATKLIINNTHIIISNFFIIFPFHYLKRKSKQFFYLKLFPLIIKYILKNYTFISFFPISKQSNVEK